MPSVGRQIHRTKPGTSFDSGGSSLGWGLGAALGAKLAAKDKTVVTLVGDGSFVFGCPTAALRSRWTPESWWIYRTSGDSMQALTHGSGSSWGTARCFASVLATRSSDPRTAVRRSASGSHSTGSRSISPGSSLPAVPSTNPFTSASAFCSEPCSAIRACRGRSRHRHPSAVPWPGE